jgi:acyl-coenzyme A thioesterase PaaI-like protein
MEEEPAFDISDSRLAAAGALRRLGHAIVGHHIDDAFFERVVGAIDSVLPGIEMAAPRRRPADVMKREMFEQDIPDGGRIDHFPDCIVSGHANPLGVAIVVHREGDEAVARTTLGAAFEGAPNRSHGGVVAAIFDDVLGAILSMLKTPAFTARLTIEYLAPTPIGVELEFRARLRERHGRKLWIDGEAYHQGQRIAEADGLFVAIDMERVRAHFENA